MIGAGVPLIVTEVEGAAEGSAVGMGGVLGSKIVRAVGPSPNPKIAMTSPGASVPCRKLAELTTAVICGSGPKTWNCASFDVPPPGVGVVTAILNTPATLRLA